MENKVFEQLMLADGRQETLSAEQENFITTHRRRLRGICRTGSRPQTETGL